MSAIWILAEQWRGELSEITFEMLALGREIADQLGVPLQAVLLGHNAKGLAASLGKADSVLSVDDPALAEPQTETWALAVAALAAERAPKAILIPLTNVSMGIGSLVAAELGSPVINFCKNLSVKDGRLEAQCVLYGGKIVSRVVPNGEMAVIGVWPGSRPPERGRAETAPPVEDVVVSLPEPRVRLKRYIEPEAGDVDLTAQDVLVGVGRGIQSQDNLELAEALASALGGAVCGSRPVIDQG